MPCSRSISKPGGVSLHWHVGAGHLSIVGTGGGAKGMSMREANERRANVDDLTAGRESWSARLLPFRRTFMAVRKAEEMPMK
jgi:hypothetical protein